MKSAIERGHEFGNHMTRDSAFHNKTEEQFEQALLETENTIEMFQPGFKSNYPKLFRAPWAKINKKMCKVLEKNNYISVLCDTYSFDPEYDSDPEFHSQLILNNVKPGSIIILHTPEDHMRSKTLQILELLIPALKAKGYFFEILSHYFKSPEYVASWEKKYKKKNLGDNLI